MAGPLGTPEILAILVIALLILGPTKLPKLARALGESLREFKKASSGLLEEEKQSLKEVSKKDALSESDKEILYKIAKKLEIDTTGLSDKEVLEKIKEKAGKK